MGVHKSWTKKMSNYRRHVDIVAAKCKEQGHLDTFVRYRDNFDYRYHELDVRFWPTQGVFECRRCGTYYVKKIVTPGRTRRFDD